MKRKIALLLAISLLLSLTACAAKSDVQFSDSAYATAPAAEAPMADMEYGAMNYAVAEESTQSAASGGIESQTGAGDADTRKIVYNADLSMTADDPAVAQSQLIARATQLGGYLADSYTTNDELGAWRCTATIKVPSERLEELVTVAKGLGKVDDYQLSSDDITLSYYDVAARLKSAQAEEKQLLEILGKCETVEDILAVRESLARVRSDIESYQGQINLWDNLVSYATLTLSVNRTPQPEVAREKELLTIWKASDVWNRMSRGFVNSARFIVNAVGAIGIFLAVAIIPAAVLFLCVGLPILFSRKRRAKRIAEAAAAGKTLPPTKAELRRAQKREKRHGKPVQAIDETDTDASKPVDQKE